VLKRGPKPKASFESLYYLADDFYRDLRRLREGDVRVWIDYQQWQGIKDALDKGMEQAGLWPDEETREHFEEVATAETIHPWKVSDPEILQSLLDAKTARQIRRICKDAYIARQDLGGKTVLNWPLRDGSTLPIQLARFAQQFIAAKRHPRFPSKKRPSNELKRLWFLARALAGAVLGIETRTALNIVGATRPEEILVHSREAKRKRKRFIRS
jgi:hypothetical protein